MDKKVRLYELIDILNEAADYYYNKNKEKLSNLEYDKLYDELVLLEEETGIIKADSPSQRVGYSVAEGLEKFTFDTPMLSLDKTKSVDKLAEFLKDKEGILSYKLDGLTVVLTYENGRLINAVTRGNGLVGEVITDNAKHFKNLPIGIPYKERLVIRGEAVISYFDFDKINSLFEQEVDRYKNPRNLCSGTVRALDSSVVAKRGVHFFVFGIVEGLNELNTYFERFEYLSNLGFEIVDYSLVDNQSIYKKEEEFSHRVAAYPYPVDGLVLLFNDIEYGLSLGSTSKFPRNAIAFKWQDENVETTLKEVFWNASRTGRINPIAIFEPIEIEGTTVSRASVHNLSMVKALKLGIGDKIKVYKANMIIPQISENLTLSDNLSIPKNCPVCDSVLEIDDNDGIQVLYCRNEDCSAKRIKSFELFVSRDGFNIDGLSTAGLELFIARGYIHEFYDIFHLEQYKSELEDLDRMGEKSISNLLSAIEKAKDISLSAFIYSLGIAQIGKSTAKLLAKEYKTIQSLIRADKESLIGIDGIGEVVADGILNYFANKNNIDVIEKLISVVRIKEVEVKEENNSGIFGKTFVITGKLNHFENRGELQVKIEDLGGKVTNSVTKKTDYLINNDVMSNSSKNKKAKDLNIPIIDEEDVLSWFLVNQ